MNLSKLQRIPGWLYNVVISVPVRFKITGIMLMIVITLGLTLGYWVTTGLSDWLSYLLTDVRVEAAMRAGARSITLMTVLAAAFSLIIGSLLTHILTRPLSDLRDMALKVAEGDLDARAPVWARDEIGEVADAINIMTDHLVKTQDDLARTNRRLAATNAIMLAAEREDEIHDILYAILETLVQVMDLETGWIYLLDPDRNMFHLASWYGVPEETQAKLLHEGRTAGCQCQQKLTDNRLFTQMDCQLCDRLNKHQQNDLKHYSIPIEALGQRYGVVNLLCNPEKELQPDDHELLATIGTQVSEIVANAWLRLKLEEKEIARQALLESLVEAQEDERLRLSRELHDGAGQMLTTLLVRIKTLEKQCPPSELQTNLQALLDLVSETVEQVRDLAYGLRPATLEEFGLSVALKNLVDEMTSNANLTAHFWTDVDSLTLPAGLDVMLYRIAQEGLTNVLRHSQAQHVIVSLTQEMQGIVMSIQDDGCGFDPHSVTAGSRSDQRHLGLVGMQERAAIAGGVLRVESVSGEGTLLQVRMPILEMAGQ